MFFISDHPFNFDIKGYTLEEILIATEYQNKGYGSMLLKELELRVREKGSACIELQAVADSSTNIIMEKRDIAMLKTSL